MFMRGINPVCDGTSATLTALTLTGNLDVAGTLNVDGQVRGKDGTAGSPAYAFDLDTDTGIYRFGTDALGFTTGGTGRWFISAGGSLAPVTTANIGGVSNLIATGYFTDIDAADDVTVGGDLIMGSGGPILTAGSGDPEGAVTADVGSIYMRTDGGIGTSIYAKESGTGNTGWSAL